MSPGSRAIAGAPAIKIIDAGEPSPKGKSGLRAPKDHFSMVGDHFRARVFCVLPVRLVLRRRRSLRQTNRVGCLAHSVGAGWAC